MAVRRDTLIPTTLDDLYDWLDEMDAAEQIAVCKLLADRATTSALVDRADRLIHALSRPPGSIASAMAATGLSRAMVQRSITRHNQHLEEQL